MSEATREIADDVTKLLDNGWHVMLYKNQLDSYTASARHRSSGRHEITDDFTPSKALYRLTEKAITGRIVDSKEFAPIPDPSKSLGELKEAAREAEQVFNRLLPLVSMPGCGKDRRAVESALTKLTAALAALEGT
jgi:hypothetical protein